VQHSKFIVASSLIDRMNELERLKRVIAQNKNELGVKIAIHPEDAEHITQFIDKRIAVLQKQFDKV